MLLKYHNIFKGMIQCPDINYPFANFEGCCKTREHQTYETACKDGEGIIVEDCQGLENKCDGKNDSHLDYVFHC